MLFSEAYREYCNPLRVKPMPPIFCQQTKVNILHELKSIEDDNKRHELTFINGYQPINTKYYKLFLESLGDVEKPDYPGVSYYIYKKLYDSKFSKDTRRKQTNSEKINPILCGWFNIPARYHHHTYTKILPKPDQQQMFATSKNYVKSHFKESLWLGSDVRGVGKTTNAVCMAMEYFVLHDFQKGKYFKYPYEIFNNSILFIKEYDLIKLVPNKHDFNPVYYRSALLNRLAEIDLLIYDDCFKFADGEFIKEFLTPLLDMRLDSNSKSTIITSTFRQSQLPKSYPDIASRLKRGVVYYSNCQTDYRDERNIK